MRQKPRGHSLFREDEHISGNAEIKSIIMVKLEEKTCELCGELLSEHFECEGFMVCPSSHNDYSMTCDNPSGVSYDENGYRIGTTDDCE